MTFIFSLYICSFHVGVYLLNSSQKNMYIYIILTSVHYFIIIWVIARLSANQFKGDITKYHDIQVSICMSASKGFIFVIFLPVKYLRNYNNC